MLSRMGILALSGYARSGKDSVADILVEDYVYTRRAFADKLREFLYAENPIVGYTGSGFGHYPTRVRDVIDEYGWDGYKETKHKDEIRQLIQRLGTEAGRNLISDTMWIDATLAVIPSRIVLTDCRFPNEAQKIKDLGGIVVRVNRPHVGPVNLHDSEIALDDWDFDEVIYNDGNLENLRTKVHALVAKRMELP